MTIREFTGTIWPLDEIASDASCPMYSYRRPSDLVWNTVANELAAKGWSDTKIQEWLQSKDARWAMDFSLGDAITKAAKSYAKKLVAGQV